MKKVQGRICKITGSGAVELDTISEKTDININESSVSLIIPMTNPLYPNSDIIIMSNNDGYIVDKGAV